ncbi:MAG: heme exporter protein CcmB [Acidobacteria bacterium]|nr:heme exporter protein CcmB [Acidobacteriota bacterium]
MLSPAGTALPSTISRNQCEPIGVSFDRVTKRYGALFALRNIQLAIGPGEFVALLGTNGSGKSTLIKLAAMAARPTAGLLRFCTQSGAEISDPIEIRSRIGLVGHSSLTYDELTAEENLELFARLYAVPSRETKICKLLESVGLSTRRSGLVRTFSRGMRQRLSIARALLPSPGLLLLDEPTTGLDQDALEWLTECLGQLHATGCTIVMSTHGASAVLALAKRTVTLSLRTEFRTRELLNTTVVFVVMVLVLFSFTFDPTAEESRRYSPGLLWLAFLFAGSLMLHPSFLREQANDTLQALRMAPIEPFAILLGKMLANFLFLTLAEWLLLPVFSILYDVSILRVLGQLLFVFALGTLGLSICGTVFSAISAHARMRELLLPLLLLPVLTPVLISSVEATAGLLAREPVFDWTWVKLLVGFDVVFLAASYMTFEYLAEE